MEGGGGGRRRREEGKGKGKGKGKGGGQSSSLSVGVWLAAWLFLLCSHACPSSGVHPINPSRLSTARQRSVSARVLPSKEDGTAGGGRSGRVGERVKRLWGVGGLRLRGGGPLLGEARIDYGDDWDGIDSHCRCLPFCRCPHCNDKTRRTDMIKMTGMPEFETITYTDRDVCPKADSCRVPRDIPLRRVPDEYANMSHALFGPDYDDIPFDARIEVKNGSFIWETNTDDDDLVGHWMKLEGRRIHVKGTLNSKRELTSILSGGWFMSYNSVGSLTDLVLQKKLGGSLLIFMNSNWTVSSCKLRVRPGPYLPGEYPSAGEWLGGNVVYADRRAEIHVDRCHVGTMPHRTRIGLFQGVCGESYAKVRVTNTMVHGLMHGFMAGENATFTAENCTLVDNRVGLAINGSARALVEHCTVGPNQLGGFCTHIGSEGAILNVSRSRVLGHFWYNVHRPGTVIGFVPSKRKPVRGWGIGQKAGYVQPTKTNDQMFASDESQEQANTEFGWGGGGEATKGGKAAADEQEMIIDAGAEEWAQEDLWPTIEPGAEMDDDMPPQRFTDSLGFGI